MATSGSREKHKEQKPESVHFWLAIVAGSLFFHSVFMFGVSRAVKVAVAEPGGGAIDVEFVEASGSKAAPEGEPIVPASSFKPEPFRPEPTPLPEFSPEPIVKPEEKPIVKPEVREEKPPIVKPEVKKPIVKPKKNKPSAPAPPPKSSPTPTTSPEVPKVPVGLPGEQDGEEPEIRLSVGLVSGKLVTKGAFAAEGEINVKPNPTISFPGKFPIQIDQIVTAEITLIIKIDEKGLATVAESTLKKLSPNLEGDQKKALEDIASNIGDQSNVTSSITTSGVHKASVIEYLIVVTIQR